jgi:hypothetical protein
LSTIIARRAWPVRGNPMLVRIGALATRIAVVMEPRQAATAT